MDAEREESECIPAGCVDGSYVTETGEWTSWRDAYGGYHYWPCYHYYYYRSSYYWENPITGRVEPEPAPRPDADAG